MAVRVSKEKAADTGAQGVAEGECGRYRHALHLQRDETTSHVTHLTTGGVQSRGWEGEGKGEGEGEGAGEGGSSCTSVEGAG